MKNVCFTIYASVSGFFPTRLVPRCRPFRQQCRYITKQKRTKNHVLESTVSSNVQSTALDRRSFETEGLSSDQRSFSSLFTIRGCEVGPDRKATVITIANLLQENGANHCVAMWGMTEAGFAIAPDMVEMNLIWVLSRMQIEMIRYPRWGDRIEIETWVRLQGRVTIDREHIIRDVTTGDVLGFATSLYVCFNTERRRPAKIPDCLIEKNGSFAAPDRPCPIPPEKLKIKIPEVELSDTSMGPSRFAGRMDLDMNNHVNNVAYLTWGLDLLPSDIIDGYQLRQVEVDYKAECEVGDRIDGDVMEVSLPEFDFGKQFIHSLYVKEGPERKELVRLRTSWKE